MSHIGPRNKTLESITLLPDVDRETHEEAWIRWYAQENGLVREDDVVGMEARRAVVADASGLPIDEITATKVLSIQQQMLDEQEANNQIAAI